MQWQGTPRGSCEHLHRHHNTDMNPTTHLTPVPELVFHNKKQQGDFHGHFHTYPVFVVETPWFPASKPRFALPSETKQTGFYSAGFQLLGGGSPRQDGSGRFFWGFSPGIFLGDV
jgi:hypothetical protein